MKCFISDHIFINLSYFTIFIYDKTCYEYSKTCYEYSKTCYDYISVSLLKEEKTKDIWENDVPKFIKAIEKMKNDNGSDQYMVGKKVRFIHLSPSFE